MSECKIKSTAHNSPVGADDGQSKNQVKNIIADELENVNSFEKYERDWLEMADPNYLHTVSMSELYDKIYRDKPPIIDGLLYPGTHLFVGAPKLGKSFFMAQLAYHISTGLPLWDYPVSQGPVLYLALEDDYRRLQKRLFQMFGTDSADNLHFAVAAKSVGNGLYEQLEEFIKHHSDTRLIIIDTLQKIRELNNDGASYGGDYEVISKLKDFAGQHGICLVLVHHTRKARGGDKFDMISGTNGLLGAADGAFLLQKQQRTSNEATLDISGRDQQDQRINLIRNPEKLLWEFVSAETELWKEPPDPVLDAVAKIISAESPNWGGTPTQLANKIGVDIKANTLSMRLNVNAARLQHEYGILYENSRNHTGRQIKLSLREVA